MFALLYCSNGPVIQRFDMYPIAIRTSRSMNASEPPLPAHHAVRAAGGVPGNMAISVENPILHSVEQPGEQT